MECEITFSLAFVEGKRGNLVVRGNQIGYASLGARTEFVSHLLDGFQKM